MDRAAFLQKAKDRRVQMLRASKRGDSLATIAAVYGISRQRVFALLKKERKR